MTNNINENPNLNKNIINGNNNINNYYYINYSPNYNQCFPTKANNNSNNISSKKREETKTNDNYIFKTDFNVKDVNILEKIDLNMIKNDKKKLIQKNENNKFFKKNIEEEKRKKKLNEKEKKLILQKQRQKEKERYIDYQNQKLKEKNSKSKIMEKSDSRKLLNHRYYNKIKNIKEINLLKKRPASSSRIITLNQQKRNNKLKYKFLSKNFFINDNQNRGKKSNLYIQIYETDRNMKRNETANNINKDHRTKTPIESYNKMRMQKRKNKSQAKLNCINNNSHIGNSINSNNILHNMNSFINLNCKTSPEEESDNPGLSKPKYNKINQIKKSKNVDKEFWEYKNVKITSNGNNKLNMKRKNNPHNNERAFSATPNKRNPSLNPNLYDNNHNVILPKNYNVNKDSYAYKITKKNNYKYGHEYENNQVTRPMTSMGNDYNNKNKKKNYVKKDIYNPNHNNLKNNICNKITQQYKRRYNSMRPNSCKNNCHENNLYFERKNNSRRYDPDITEPELLMMVNPIKIKDNYKNLQKNSLNITVNSNNNAENPNNFLHHLKALKQNLNINTNIANGKGGENIDWNKIQMNSNSKYNHLKLFNNIYINNDKNNDEPIKVVKIFQ